MIRIVPAGFSRSAVTASSSAPISSKRGPIEASRRSPASVGATLRVLWPDAQGHLHPQDLKALLTARTRVFAVTACANAGGLVRIIHGLSSGSG